MTCAPPDRLFGIYVPGVPPDLPRLHDLERRLGRHAAMISVYCAWGRAETSGVFAEVRAILAEGRIPLVTWEPWAGPEGTVEGADPSRDPRFRLRHINDGRFDAYVGWWAQQIERVPGRVLLRPMHEMNGNWYPWCGTRNGNHPEEFVSAWRRVHGIFAEAGARNVDWVWSPYAVSVPDVEDNGLSAYYPGEAYVDWMALDGYNWGATQPWSCWQEFGEIFDTAYRTLAALGSRAILITEMGCAETGGNKPAWIRNTSEIVDTRYPRIRGVVWFNADKECDWRIESSEESLRAFREAWAPEARTA
jgi:hypothetical protein